MIKYLKDNIKKHLIDGLVDKDNRGTIVMSLGIGGIALYKLLIALFTASQMFNEFNGFGMPSELNGAFQLITPSLVGFLMVCFYMVIIAIFMLIKDDQSNIRCLYTIISILILGILGIHVFFVKEVTFLTTVIMWICISYLIWILIFLIRKLYEWLSKKDEKGEV